ncbi:hypothetical protein AN963_24710 [Brevibacillus choshinensis]|uniref:Uncharacterized protein n=1 Tax=Brevibacillus choshinensis TaxID=54911 RepID=A0ABR5N266_BRECH|nr:hypothetical protein AN963_24710 [Brevibacillus choshinensis]
MTSNAIYKPLILSAIQFNLFNSLLLYNGKPLRISIVVFHITSDKKSKTKQIKLIMKYIVIRSNISQVTFTVPIVMKNGD